MTEQGFVAGMPFRLGTFSTPGNAAFAGMVLSERVLALSTLAMRVRELAPLERSTVLDLLTDWERSVELLKHGAQAMQWHPEWLRDSGCPVQDVTTHAPVDLPRQIFCAIANYRSHMMDVAVDAGMPPDTDGMDVEQRRAYAAQAIEQRLQGRPYMAFKLPSTVIGPQDSLVLPTHAVKPDWEVELGVIIGRGGERIEVPDAMNHVAGYTVVNDITMRERVARKDVRNMGTDWLESKNAPGFLPVGPYLVPAEFVPDPYSLRLSLRLNGEIRQDHVAGDMMFDIAQQVSYVSQHARLLPGDLICTGTPAGCGTHFGRFLQPGDLIEATITGLGTQRTRCITAA